MTVKISGFPALLFLISLLIGIWEGAQIIYPIIFISIFKSRVSEAERRAKEIIGKVSGLRIAAMPKFDALFRLKAWYIWFKDEGLEEGHFYMDPAWQRLAQRPTTFV